MNIADEIKSRVKMPDLLRFYGFELGRGNRMPCPFHHGENRNFSVKDDFFHCFVCGESGDVISFVMKYFSLDFRAAVRKISEDFNLGLPIGKKLTDRERMELARREFQRKQALKAEQAKKNALQERYDKALDRYEKIQADIENYAPKSPEDEIKPEYIKALSEREYASYELDNAESELMNYGNK